MFCNIPKRGIRYRYILVLSAVTKKKMTRLKYRNRLRQQSMYI